MNPHHRWSVRRFRDLQIMESPHGDLVVIACDSVGGIGSKPADTFTADPRVAIHFGARVPLLELVAVGAQPTLIVDTLSVEKAPSGSPMIEEVREIARDLGLDPDVAVSGSTEDNVATVSTGFGITVVGVATPGTLKVANVSVDDTIVCIGVPLSAPRDTLRKGDPRMPSISEVATLAALDFVHETLPVGSRGIAAECADLAQASGLHAVLQACDLDLTTTAGPSACVIAAVDPTAVDRLRSIRTTLPITVDAHARSPHRENP